MESLRLVCLNEANLTDEQQAELRCEIDGEVSLDGAYEGNKVTCCGPEVGWVKCLKRLSSNFDNARIPSDFTLLKQVLVSTHYRNRYPNM